LILWIKKKRGWSRTLVCWFQILGKKFYWVYHCWFQILLGLLMLNSSISFLYFDLFDSDPLSSFTIQFGSSLCGLLRFRICCTSARFLSFPCSCWFGSGFGVKKKMKRKLSYVVSPQYVKSNHWSSIKTDMWQMLTVFTQKLTEGTTLVNGEILKGPNWDSLKLGDQIEIQK
jgi:hypothetical protein